MLSASASTRLTETDVLASFLSHAPSNSVSNAALKCLVSLRSGNLVQTIGQTRRRASFYPRQASGEACLQMRTCVLLMRTRTRPLFALCLLTTFIADRPRTIALKLHHHDATA